LPSVLRGIQRLGEENNDATLSTLGSLNTVVLMDKARAEAQLSMQLYSELFGGLPYGRIAMTQQPFPNFGQAWPMLVYMPITAYFDSTQRHALGIDAANFFKFVAAHEVAHQWWGHIIGWKTYRDQWMSEGFSEFSASMFAQAVYKNEKFIEFWKEERELITTKNRTGKRPSEVGGVYMGYRLDTPKTGNVTRAMIYPKGAFILHMLRMMMWDPKKSGDARFSEMMKDFVKTYYNKNVTTQDFWNVVNKHMTSEMNIDGSGNMNWFFTQWVYGTSIPHYKLDYRIDPAEDGQVRLSGRIIQTNVDSTFKMIVPVYADFDGKVTRLGTMAVTGNSTTPAFNIILPRKPKKIMLNYFEDVLCTMDER
jgi:aminopeptidase N